MSRFDHSDGDSYRESSQRSALGVLSSIGHATSVASGPLYGSVDGGWWMVLPGSARASRAGGGAPASANFARTRVLWKSSPRGVSAGRQNGHGSPVLLPPFVPYSAASAGRVRYPEFQPHAPLPPSTIHHLLSTPPIQHSLAAEARVGVRIVQGVVQAAAFLTQKRAVHDQSGHGR